MARIEYKLFNVDPVGLEELSEFDLKNVSSFAINTTFQAFENKIELHVYTEEDVLIESIYDYRKHKFLQGSETAGVTGASELTLNPIQDAIDLNYELGGVKFVYNFLDNLYSEEQAGGEFFIQDISEDRTELRLLTNQLTEEEIIDGTSAIIEDLESESYFNDFRLNVKNNDLLIGTNIKIEDFRDFKSVIVKLYEPLPLQYQKKDLLTIERTISDSVAYRIETTITPDEVKVPTLKGPNFNIEEPDSLSYPTSFLSTDDLFSFPTNNTYREVNSLFKEKGIELSIDYNNYSNFVLFSSAEERLRNFKYKLDLIEGYQKNADSASAAIAAGNTRFISGSEKYWKDRVDSVIQNFDHYDRHLYYESGSTSWPKQQPQNKPYINATGSTTSSFYSAQLLTASAYDYSNNSSLVNTVPEYLREDTNSTNYSVFVNMLGQHFDNIWVYAKALSDKYDNDNRLNYGIAKDLVQDTLKNFGVKIYNSFQSTDDLFNTFTGKLYHSASNDFQQTGSLIVASLSGSIGLTIPVSASEGIVPLDSLESYKRQINKRLYHNLPYLLKTKGTERGIKALIASFGVPTDNNIIGSGSNLNGLQVRTIGGANTTAGVNFGPLVDFTSSLDKIRIDNTGSLVTGSTLSNYTSVFNLDKKYSDDNHTIEVGYSPTYPLNDYIKGQLTSNFNIDDLIGDPRAAYSSSYELLISESNRVITSGSHHYGEFVRILKFYDNVLFKMIRDFVPARANIDTGIIIKPHLLERNKIKQVQGSFEEKQYTGSIDTAFLSGSQAGAFTHRFNQEFEIPLTASYTESIVTPLGVAQYDYHLKERTRYDGEFTGSYIEIYDHSLNDDNIYKYNNPDIVSFSGRKFCFVAPPPPSPSNTPSNTPSNSAPAPSVPVTPSPSPSPSGAPLTHSFYITEDTFADVDDIQSSAVCSYAKDGSYVETVSTGTLTKVYVQDPYINNISQISSGDTIYYSSDDSRVNNSNNYPLLYGIGNTSGGQAAYWVFLDGNPDAGTIITDPSAYPGNPGKFPTGSGGVTICSA